MKRTVTVCLGLLEEPISKQIGFTNEAIEMIERCNDAANLLVVKAYLTHSEDENVRKRLMKKIKEEIKKEWGRELWQASEEKDVGTDGA